jgi:phage-related protein
MMKGGTQAPGIPGQGRADDAHGHHHQSQAQHFEKTEEVGQTAQKQQADQGAQHIGHENLRDMAGLQPPGLLVERVERAGKRRSHDADAHGKAHPGIGTQTGLHWEALVEQSSACPVWASRLDLELLKMTIWSIL